MRNSRLLFPSGLWFTLCLLLGLLPSCSINVKKGENGEDKKVDIETPVGDIHVDKQPDVREIGLPVYPGAHPISKSGPQEKSAAVNISNPLFGLKVVAQEYESDAGPERLLAFYRNQLKKYGKVLECNTSWHRTTDVDVEDDDAKQSHELSCRQDTGGDTTELKVGSKQSQHIVAVKPQGKGAKFALVFVQVRGRQDMI